MKLCKFIGGPKDGKELELSEPLSFRILFPRMVWNVLKYHESGDTVSLPNHSGPAVQFAKDVYAIGRDGNYYFQDGSK